MASKIEQNSIGLQNILAMVNALPEAGSGEVEITLQQKSVTPTKSAQEVTADSGYDGLSKVDVGAIPDEYIVPSGTKNITANGTHDVTANASVSVNVPVPDGYIVPSGTKTITANGEHDVTSFAKASVNIPIPDGYVKPSGTLNITENGTYDVTEKASVAVSVAGSGGGGSGVESCTLSFTAQAEEDGLWEIYYTKVDSNGNATNVSEFYDNPQPNKTFTIPCNSMVMICTENTHFGGNVGYELTNVTIGAGFGDGYWLLFVSAPAGGTARIRLYNV